MKCPKCSKDNYKTQYIQGETYHFCLHCNFAEREKETDRLSKHN